MRTPAEHARVWRQGRRRSVGPLVVVAVKNDLHWPRLGFAVSKRAQRRAVDRNRIKRLIRESFRHEAQDLPALDIVVSLSHRVPLRDTADLRQALERAWRELKRC